MYTFKTKGICSRQITVELEGEIIKRVEFLGGCAGNTLGISQMVKGMNAKDVIKTFKGINCQGRGTSCPDQLAKALEEALDAS
ncbi:MAG: TIGR03905 family TSCPD domain-containing protein [Oscillospiraceae bacterium]|nr:TIGR03905 family TSCPD domain-containing protein [Oscillospiraceae bacterium]